MTSTKSTGPITPENPFEVTSKLLPQAEPYTISDLSDLSDTEAIKLRKKLKAKNAHSNPVIKRNKEKELLVWNKLIKPIVESHHLKSPSTGELFQYEFFPKKITERDVEFIIRETMLLCDKLSQDTNSFDSPKHKSYSINHQIMQPLLHKGEKTKFMGKNGENIDLKREFREFLTTLFPDKLSSSKAPSLPAFLEMLNRETEISVADEGLVKLDQEANSKNGRAPKLAAAKQADVFIKSLTFSSLDNGERIKIKVPDKRHTHSYPIGELFPNPGKNGKNKARDLLLKMLNKGGVCYAGRTKDPGYDSTRALLREIDKKLRVFINNKFPSLTLNPDFKFSRNDKAGAYLFVFKVSMPEDYPEEHEEDMVQKYRDMTNRDLTTLGTATYEALTGKLHPSPAEKEKLSKILEAIKRIRADRNGTNPLPEQGTEEDLEDQEEEVAAVTRGREICDLIANDDD